MKKILNTLLLVTLLISCTQPSNDEVVLNKINVLWENESIHSNELADSIFSVNPDKFVLNVDGPGSFDKPNTGPTLIELKTFISYLRGLGWNGKLVMHPDCAKGEYQHDWNGQGKLPKIDTTNVKSWQVYVTYFNQIQDALPTNSKFSELMIETENTYFMTNGKVKLQTKDSLFPKIKKFIKDPTVSLSTTSDWEVNWKNWSVDYYYAQIYDMAYMYPCLGGHNKYSNGRVDTLINRLRPAMSLQKNMVGDSVYFIFTYSDLEKTPYIDAPMFGEMMLKNTSKEYVWNRSEFMEFNREFKKTFTNQTNTGIWSVEDAFKNW
tara:strand:+ start:6035 stop:6997 length:963 start_codon:yes stop_codon:yes gene_type:complete